MTPILSPEHGQQCQLAGAVLEQNDRLLLRVRGESMIPTLWPGELVEVVSAALRECAPEDIVLLNRDDRLVLHRLVGSTEASFRARGDSVVKDDPIYNPEALIGRARSVLRPHGFVELRPRSGYAKLLAFTIKHWTIARRMALLVHAFKHERTQSLADPALQQS